MSTRVQKALLDRFESRALPVEARPVYWQGVRDLLDLIHEVAEETEEDGDGEAPDSGPLH